MDTARPKSRRACPCGAFIAADNTDRLCHRCRRNARADVHGPPEVPNDFWDHPAIAAACPSRSTSHHPAATVSAAAAQYAG